MFYKTCEFSETGAVTQRTIKGYQIATSFLYFFDIGHPAIIDWHLSKQGICWPVTRDHIAGSSLQLIEVTCFFKLIADQVLVFDWIAGSCPVNLLKTGQECSETGYRKPRIKIYSNYNFFLLYKCFFLLLYFVYMVNRKSNNWWFASKIKIVTIQ